MMQHRLLVAGLIMLPSAVSAQVSTATGGGSGVSAATPIPLQKTTIAELPACTTENAGSLYMVMDGSQKNQWGKTFSDNSSTTPMIAVCSGQQWEVH